MKYFNQNKCYHTNPNKIGYKPNSKTKYYSWEILHADCNSFLVRAWGNVDEDEYIDIWEITEMEKWYPIHVFDDTTNLGDKIDPLYPSPWMPSEGEFRDGKKIDEIGK